MKSPHLGSKPGGDCDEPVHPFYNADLHEIHIPGENIHFHKATPRNPADPNSNLMLQRISGSEDQMDVQWKSHWDRIQELESLPIQGLLKYYTQHITKKPEGSGYDIMMVTEFAQGSIQSIQSSSSPLELLDLIQMMNQVNTTLCDLERFGHSHQSINPEVILVKRMNDGEISYKLASSISSIPISGKKYEERTEYLPYIAPSQSSHPNDIKNDVYSLGITFLDVAGVSKDTLMKIRSGDVNNFQASQDSSVLEELIQLVLEAVNTDYTQRLSSQEFGERLAALLARARDFHDFTLADFVRKFEEIEAIHAPLKDQIMITEEHHPTQIQLIVRDKDEGVSQRELPSPGTASPAQGGNIIKESKITKLFKKCKPSYLIAYVNKMSKKQLKKVLIFLSIILSLLTIAIVIDILYKGFAKLKASDELAGAMDYVYENLNTVPYASITVVDGSSCPSGFTNISSFGNWGGTVAFCYDDGFVDTDTPSGRCDNYYNAQASRSFSSWKNLTICAQPVTGFSNASQCSSSETSCYTGVCVPSSEACPITTLQLSDSFNSDSGWTWVQYNSSLFINYRQDAGALPLATFRINIGEAKSCLSSQEYSSQKGHPANIINGTGCTEYGEFPDSSTVDTDNALEAFYAQSWTSGVLKLPGYATLLNSQTAYLTASPRLELAASCTSFNVESLQVGANSLRTVRTLTIVLGLIAIISICLSLVIVLVLEFVFTVGGQVDTTFSGGCQGEKNCMSGGFQIGFYLSYPITAVVIIVAAALTRANYSSYSPYFDDYKLITENCFIDETVQSTVQAFADGINTAKSIYYLWIGLAVPYWVIFIVWIYIGYKYAKKK